MIAYMDFLVVEESLHLVEGLSTVGREAFVFFPDDSINSDVFEVRYQDLTNSL
jgi:hypothetical protein